MNELKNFLVEEGKLRAYPTKKKMKILSLFYLASKFEKGKKYTEKEINEILKKWHTFEDWAMLRRDLYDHWFSDARRMALFIGWKKNSRQLNRFNYKYKRGTAINLRWFRVIRFVILNYIHPKNERKEKR